MKTSSLLSQAVNCPLIPIQGPHVTDCTEALNSRSQERGDVWRHVTTVAFFLDDNKTNDDGDAKENGKKMFVLTNNNFARESRYFVHFFAIVAPLPRGDLQLKRRDKLRRPQQKYLQRPPSLYTNGAQTLES